MSSRTGALRRRRKRSLATRLRIAWVFLAFALAVLGYGAYTLVTLPALRARSVDVRIDGTAVSEREVRAAAAIDPNANVWLLDTGAIARRIEAIPYVDTARLDRALPAQIVIDVAEREPAACVRAGARDATIDRTRRILQTGCADPALLKIELGDAALGVPGTVAGAPVLATLLADGRALHDAGLGIRSVAQDRFGELVAIDVRGVELLFGADSDLAQKAALVGPVVAASRPGRTIRSVDLRAPATPTVVYR